MWICQVSAVSNLGAMLFPTQPLRYLIQGGSCVTRGWTLNMHKFIFTFIQLSKYEVGSKLDHDASWIRFLWVSIICIRCTMSPLHSIWGSARDDKPEPHLQTRQNNHYKVVLKLNWFKWNQINKELNQLCCPKNQSRSFHIYASWIHAKLNTCNVIETFYRIIDFENM